MKKLILFVSILIIFFVLAWSVSKASENIKSKKILCEPTITQKYFHQDKLIGEYPLPIFSFDFISDDEVSVFYIERPTQFALPKLKDNEDRVEMETLRTSAMPLLLSSNLNYKSSAKEVGIFQKAEETVADEDKYYAVINRKTLELKESFSFLTVKNDYECKVVKELNMRDDYFKILNDMEQKIKSLEDGFKKENKI